MGGDLPAPVERKDAAQPAVNGAAAVFASSEGKDSERGTKTDSRGNSGASALEPVAPVEVSPVMVLDPSAIALDLETYPYPVAALGGGKADKDDALNPIRLTCDC